MSELDYSCEGEQEHWGAGKGRGRRDMEVLTPDPRGRCGRAGWKGAASLQEVSTEGQSQGAVGGGLGDTASGCLAGPEGQLQALSTLPG